MKIFEQYFAHFKPGYWVVTCFLSLLMPASLFPQCSQPDPSIGLNVYRGYAGNDTYTITIPNSSGMTICVRYVREIFTYHVSLDGPMNPEGALVIPLPQNAIVGTYTFMAIKNSTCSPCSNTVDHWLSLNQDFPSRMFTVDPPQPTTLSFNGQTNVRVGQSFTMTVGNGYGVTLDSRSTIGGQEETQVSFPSLDRTAFPNGSANIWILPCAQLGNRVYTGLRNTRNTAWRPFSVGIDILPPFVPYVQTVTPTHGTRGSDVGVTITGFNLYYCAPTSSITTVPANWPGLTFLNVSSAEEGTGIYATFRISATASIGNVGIKVTTAGGISNTVYFLIDPAQPTVTSVVPNALAQGSSDGVVINGSNLFNASLTNQTDLSFTNLILDTENGSWVRATFNVARGASPGSRNILLNATGGSTNFSFTITVPPITLRKEYIYVGGRLIAVEVP